MGRKLDLSGLTDNEAEHVLQVVQRDMKLRKKEEKRLSELKQELDEEGSRCLLLSRQSCFNQRCCIRCCLPFTFLLNPKRQCRDCRYNVCKACRLYNKQDKAWVCSACQKSRLLKTQSLEWFYTDVKTRFKRFGSAKVLKTLYRKHLAEHRALSELTEGSVYEESVCNEGSICGSDSTFYRQSEEHSMAETLTVALRVAEEAIDEAIDEAEFDTASQEKQDEAQYLREHRGELVEELAKTIVQKIISRRKTLTEMTAKYDQDWPLEQNTDPHHHPHHQSICDQPSCFIKHRPGLWRSHSAFSLLSNDHPGLVQDSLQALMKEGSGSMSGWKSVDRLDNAGVSSVLKSPDGNWIALQSVQLSRPSLLTKRKSLVYSALERESGVVSAYEGMGSDNETKTEPDSSWGAALQEIHRKMTDSNSNLHDTRDRIPSPLMGRRGSGEEPFSDSEGNWKMKKPLLALFKRKVPAEIRRPSASQRTSIIDVNFNVGGATEEEEEEEAAEPTGGKVRRSRKKRKSNKKEQVAASSVSDFNKKDNQAHPTPDAVTSDTLTCGATTPEPFDLESDTTGLGANQMDEELTFKLQLLTGRVSESSTGEEELDKDIVEDCDDDGPMEDRDEEDESLWKMEIDLDEGRMEEENVEDDLEVDEEMKYRLYRLVTQSRLAYFSSTDDELDKVGQSEGEWDEDNNEQEEEKTEGLTYKLCQLEKEVRASQFSSTEDELDRVGVDEKKTEEGEEDGSIEELARKVCRLANQVNATQFSSTEDELDRTGRGRDGEQGMDEEPLWKLQAEKALQAAQLRDLASLVSASQFSSTEDELDRGEKHEGEREQEENEGEIKSSFEIEEEWGGAVERKESLGDLDVKMFDLRDEIEETKSESGDERATAGNVLDYLFKIDDVQEGNTEMEAPVMRDFLEETLTEEIREEITEHEVHIWKDKVENETQGRREMKMKSEVEAEKTEELGARVEQGNQLEAKWPDENEEEAFEESKEGQGKWEATADSEEEEAEFERIISSMLTMTLEDMQVETLNDAAAEIGRINEEPEDMKREGSINKTRRESGFTEKMVDAQSTNASEETGGAKEFQSQGNDVRSESAGRENVTELIGGDTSGKKESGETAIRNRKEQEERERDPQERRTLALETNEPQHTCRRIKVDDEEQEDARGKMATEERVLETQGAAADGERDRKERDENSEEDTSSLHEGLLSPEEIQHELNKTMQFMTTLLEQRYSAVSLRSITTEVLKVLNATEELLQGFKGDAPLSSTSTSLPLNTDPKKLDQQFSRLEENVYVAAGSVYSLEAELGDLEECARGICSSTSNMELSFLEEQVASAAAKVQQSELQICDISARIAALKSAGLNVDTQSRFTRTKTIPVMPVTLDSTRQLRRRLPAPPVKDKDT
ncbi:rab effector MyRIP isoform X2 [Scophthalmus maximus]|uniref:rab effector MyRIP isoform X2 n=1 Tax=Scophthalmus maximus TaxID=52904 RepID=UPI001FA8ECB4|nr:rab effector MyRIP isoform X2 [Scophthalmus maximus]